MKKLLLAAALLTSVASAQFIEGIKVDPMTDEVTNFSTLATDMTTGDISHKGYFSIACKGGNSLYIIVTNDHPLNKGRVHADSIEFRILPSERSFGSSAAAEMEGVVFFNLKGDSLEQLSNSEVRVRFKGWLGNKSYYHSFNVPDVTQSEAYRACNTR